jgi:HSP20 family protein
MDLIRWDPYRELTSLADRMNRAFGNFGLPATRTRDEELPLGAWMPPVDIVEEKDKIVLTAELPGFTADQVDVQMEGGVLTVKGERKMEEEKEGRNYHRVERSYGQFVRSFTLPNNVNRDGIKANFANGLLTVELPKREEAKPRQIKIEGSTPHKAIDVKKA